MARTATVIRPTGRDAHGDPLAGDPTRITITVLGVAPSDSTPITGRARDGALVPLTLYLEFGVDVRHGDQVELDGEVYDVDGEPQRWENLRSGRQPGAVVQVRRSRG